MSVNVMLINFYNILKIQMKKGHRRTESENIFNHQLTPQLKIKVGTQSNHKRILSLVKASSRLNKQKTVCVETLQIPKSKSQYSNMFVFGKKDGQESTLANSPFSQYLLSIPERKPVSRSSLHKGVSKDSPLKLLKNGKKWKGKQKTQERKKEEKKGGNVGNKRSAKKYKSREKKEKKEVKKKSQDKVKKKLKITKK